MPFVKAVQEQQAVIEDQNRKIELPLKELQAVQEQQTIIEDQNRKMLTLQQQNDLQEQQINALLKESQLIKEKLK